MKNKKTILVGAKITLCAMLLLITASAASASTSGDFGFTDVGSRSVSAGSINNLALEVVIPDGVNGGTEDILLVDGGTAFYTGDTLVAIPALGTTTGVGYYEAVPDGFQGTEPVVRDLDADGVYTASADTDIDGLTPAAGTPIVTAKDADWTTLYFYDNAGGGAWDAVNDIIFVDDGNIYYDTALDTVNGGTPSVNPLGTITEPATWLMYFYDDTDANGQFDNANDWAGLDDDSDGVYTSAADAIYIDGADALPVAGAALVDVVAADNICSDNADLALATCVYSDTDGTACDGTQGSGTDFLGVGCELGTDVLIGTADNWATNETPFDATTDWFKENVAEELTYSAAADTTAGGTAPAAGTPITTTKDTDWTSLYFFDAVGGGVWNGLADLIFTDDGNIYYDDTLDTHVAGATTENALGTLTEPATWDLWYFDAVNGGAYNGAADWIGVDAGGSGTYSTSADDDVYSTGGMVDDDALVNFPADCDGASAGTQACLHTGATPIDSSESILIDEGTDQGAAPNGVVDEENDQLTGIEIKNNGTAVNTEASSVKVWLDDGDNTFEPGSGDANLGAAVWDTVDSWDLTGLTTAITAGGIKLFVGIDITSPPIGTNTFILAIPQNGVTVTSVNDGPTDADAAPLPANNTLTIAIGGGGGGGGGGGTSGDCGDGILDSNETCDDGNRTAGDGCNVYCSLEDGYVWDAATKTVISEAEAAAQAEEALVESTTTEEPTPESVTGEALSADDIADVADNFSDYDETHWAAEYIAKLYLANIMTGYGDSDMFGVAMPTTRAEMVKVALLANGIDVPASVDVAPFDDTPKTEWYTPYVTTAADLGIVEGYDDGNFRPGNNINRAEALKVLLLAKGVDVEGYDTTSATSFSDVSESIWYAAYVAYAVDNDLIEGYADGTFKGGNDILRAEIAKLTVVIMLLEMAA
jgi:cysteine-rich repeat protein